MSDSISAQRSTLQGRLERMLQGYIDAHQEETTVDITCIELPKEVSVTDKPFVHNNRPFARSSDSRTFYDLTTGEIAAVMQEYVFSSPQVIGDHTLFLGTDDCTLYDFPSGRRVATFPKPVLQQNGVCVYPTADSGLVILEESRGSTICDAFSGEVVQHFPTRISTTSGIHMLNSRSVVLNRSQDMVLDILTRKVVSEFPYSVDALVAMPDGKVLARERKRNGVFYDAATGKEIVLFPKPISTFYDLKDIDGKCYALATDRRTLYDFTSGERKVTFPHIVGDKIVLLREKGAAFILPDYPYRFTSFHISLPVYDFLTGKQVAQVPPSENCSLIKINERLLVEYKGNKSTSLYDPFVGKEVGVIPCEVRYLLETPQGAVTTDYKSPCTAYTITAEDYIRFPSRVVRPLLKELNKLLIEYHIG